MSTDELKTRTVCLKLAKNCSSVYLNKNLTSNKIIPKESSFSLRHSKEFYENVLKNSFKNSDSVLQNSTVCIKNEPDTETVLQKFIRGFDCRETCDHLTSSSDCSLNTNSSRNRIKEEIVDSSYNSQKPFCKVEFITPSKIESDNIGQDEKEKPWAPLVVDFSQKKTQQNEEISEKLIKPSTSLKGLIGSFITPKIKVENVSSISNISSLQLVISSLESSKYENSSSSLHSYPSTKVEIDYSGTSFQDFPQNTTNIDVNDFPRPIKSDVSEINQTVSQKIIFNNKNDFNNQEQVATHSSSNSDKTNSQALVNILLEGVNSAQKDVLKAAKALYSKRTRTLFHWINPKIPKTKLKDSVMTSWDQLPPWQKQIYISQVIGKYGNESLSPMINPQILDMSVMVEAALADLVEESHQPTHPVRKKRKYTRRTPLASATTSSNGSNLNHESSVHQFLSSL